MRVLVISSHYERPGSFTGQPVHRLSRELAAQGADVRVMCPIARLARPVDVRSLARLTKRSWDAQLNGLHVSYLPYSNFPHGLSAARDGRNLARKLTVALPALNWWPDVVHAHRLFPTGDGAVQLGQSAGLPVVVTAHGSDVHTHPLRNEQIASRTRFVVRSADRVATVSDYLSSQLSSLEVPRHPARTVHFGVDTEIFKPVGNRSILRRRLALPDSGTGFVSVCRLSPRKGVIDLIRSFEMVAKRDPEAWLALVGEGPARDELERRVESAGIGGSVRFAGAVHNDEVPRWLGAADVFVLASYAEGLPNVVLEAMGCALPVIATDVGGTAEAIAGDTGILVKPGDTHALFTAMVDLATDPERRSQLGETARVRVKTHFSWTLAAKRYLELYAAALSDRAAPSGGM